MRASWIVLAVALLSSAPSFVRAQALPDGVLLEVVRCPGSAVDAAGLLEDVRVELASDGIRDVRERVATSEPEGALALVRVEEPCAPDGAFLLHIDDLLTRKSVERRLSLTDLAPSAVSRALALGIAELLRASWAELEIAEVDPDTSPALIAALRVRVRGLREARALADPSATPERVVAPTPAAIASADEPPRGARARVFLAAAAVVRSFPGSSSAPIGARLSLDVPLTSVLVLRIDGEALYGTSLDRLGAIDLGLADGGLTLAALVAIGDAQITIGARVGAGIAWTRGRPSDPATLAASGDAFVLLVGAVAELDAPIGDIVSLRFGVEVGGAPVGLEARVGSTPVAGISGASLSGWGGLALAL